MIKQNNLYNFKNPVKNFLDIDKVIVPESIDTANIKKLCWVEPFNFRVKKEGDKFRTLKMPNILNFICAYNHFKDLPNFENIQSMDSVHKRLSANIETGDFSSGEYDCQLAQDFNKLCIYDNLIKLDIKEYYGRLYTHYLDYQEHDEHFLSNMNLGATNGLIMGNYLSLYFAELNLNYISNDINLEISNQNIDCEFSYFSDDFYFFCNKHDSEKIIKIFDKVLEKYQLERSESKKEIWDYETFNIHNTVAQHWKKLIAHSNIRYKKDSDNNKLYFINQIIYRMSKLEDEKLKKVFINNFFKTEYFRELNLEKFKVNDYDYHQLCFILKYSPEALLYSIDKFNEMSNFDNNRLKKFFEVRYKEALRNSFHEEQLYLFYSIKILGFDDLLPATTDYVLESNNQILTSYYLKYNLFTKKNIDLLKTKVRENYWFQNYHLIIYSEDLFNDLENSIEKYLMPKKATKLAQKESYKTFYRENIAIKNDLIRDIAGVNSEIIDYLCKKIEENKEVYEEVYEE